MEPECLRKLERVLKHYSKLSLTSKGKVKKGFQDTGWILFYVESQLNKL
jgi:hypothetical protein